MLSQKEIKKIIEEKASVFKALEEFEKTGSTKTKTRMNFTVDRELAKKFREYCKKHSHNMSSKVEQLMGKTISFK